MPQTIAQPHLALQAAHRESCGCISLGGPFSGETHQDPGGEVPQLLEVLPVVVLLAASSLSFLLYPWMPRVCPVSGIPEVAA